MRKKNPEFARQALLDSAAELAARQGLAAITVQAVADAAQVTKGCLFHHFPNKQALVDALLAQLLERLDARIDALVAADPIPYGRFTRAYIALIFDDPHPRARAAWAAIMGLSTADRAIGRQWAKWLADRLTAHDEAEGAAEFEIARLAAEGAWHRYLVDGQAPPLLTDVRQRLIAASHGAHLDVKDRGHSFAF